MKSKDRDLGMDRTISRRDLLHGMGALAAGANAMLETAVEQGHRAVTELT